MYPRTGRHHQPVEVHLRRRHSTDRHRHFVPLGDDPGVRGQMR